MENPIVKKYVLGFLIRANGGGGYPSFAMILNDKGPQADRWNGLGGKVEEGETPYQAMVRECKEESGIACPNWTHFCNFYGADYEVDCFVSIFTGSPEQLTNPVLNVDWMGFGTILDRDFPAAEHVRWLVPMALARTQSKFIAAVDCT